MAHVIAITNFKGGVGKTTSTIHIAHALVRMGKVVLVVDMDGQCNTSFHLGYNPMEEVNTVDKCIMDDMLTLPLEPQEYIDNFDFCPTTELIGTCASELKNKDAADARLKWLLAPYQNVYDYILIDCPPNNDIQNTNALVAADYVLIPIQAGDYPLQGLSRLIKKIMSVQKFTNTGLKILGMFFTNVRKDTNKFKDSYRDVADKFSDVLLNEYIRQDTKFEGLASVHKTIYDVAKYCNGALDYTALVKTIVKRVGE